MDKIKGFPFTLGLFTLVGLAIVASFVQEIGNAMSGLMVQLNLCEEDNYICILSYWSIVVVFLVLFTVILDLWASRKREFNKVEEMKDEKASINWIGIRFEKWDARFSNVSARCGIEIINNSDYKISECYVELIELFEENNGEYINIYGELKSQLPCLLAWQIHNEFVYGKIEIEKTDSRYLAISYDEDYLCIKGEKDFRYAWSPHGHVVAEIKVRGKIGAESMSPKNLFVEMYRDGRRVTTKGITDKFPKLPPALSKLSFYLNEMMKDKNISGPSISFLNKIRASPPFLGIVDSIISPEIERDLTEYFLAKQFVETRKESLRGGESYQVKPDDESLNDVSKKIYGDERFVEQLIEANYGATTLPPKGSYITTPTIDTSDPFRLSTIELERMLFLAKESSIEPTIDKLVNQFYLVKHETLWLMETIFAAAQKALNE